jgi:PKD repeat protein
MGALTGGDASKWNGQFSFNIMGAVNNSTPVTPQPGCNREYLAAGSVFSNLFKYDESIVNGDCYLNGWIPLNTSAPTPRGKGFAARINDAGIINSNRILSETGTYTNADYSSGTLSITGSNTTNSTAYNSKGAHILSNPFWAPIDWRSVTGTNLDGTAYKYNPSTGTYVAMNNANINPVVISTNEAFTVYPLNNALSGFSVSIPKTARITSANNEFYRQQQPFQYALKITATSADNESDYTHIIFDNNFTDGYDNGYDARKLFSSLGVPSIYTRDADNERNVILAISETTQPTTIPLGVAIEYNGNHTLTFDGINDFPATAIIWLEDLQTGAIQYLRQNNTYPFTANKTDQADRFLLHFAPEMLIAVTAADCEQHNGIISITERGGLNWSYELKDNNNQTVSQHNNFSGTQINITNLSEGSYSLHLENAISGYSTVINLNVTGLQPVTAAINATQTNVMVNELFTAEAQATGATRYDWQMGDGTTYINQQNVTHAYQMPGIYEITLTAQNDDCSATATQNITVDLSTGITENKENPISIYASNNTIYISKHNSHTIEKATVNLFNTLGQKMMDAQTITLSNTPQTIQMNIAAGIYYVSVQAESEHKITVRKVMLGEN